MILVYLMLSSPEPVSYADLGKFIGTSKASISRNVRLLGTWMQKDAKSHQWTDVGLGLITVYPDPYNTRQYIAKLTDQGIALMKKIDKAVS
jgi:DNA-binding MarR family transcriptional regulator